ncbi:Ferredoxin-nitrite reductase [Nitrospina gracilis 3/211]|uniref:Ferredoxin-nitrite reductase n=1 Tax=Nitrospina gracilis (strain 3/211) TaxID=1266370 RepID=M1YW92_NITG3|nr:hypothetical protein [Nitrospina gracilis]CCQ89742.1 Ferredoxin-nitrite reductase [Nitrospina gracilis 3/211]
MNKIEELKLERDGLDIKADIARFAKEGWDCISEDDITRLKWYGLFLRKPTPGFFMLRVRIPNGYVPSYQLKALAHIAGRFGNGQIDITTRQQVQLRHLKIDDVPAVFDLMDAVGLTSIQTGMDNVRNIMGCPVGGLHPKESLNASPVIEAMNEYFLGNREFSNLPRKFNIAVTGCPDSCIHTETQDLALVPASREEDGETVYGFNLLVGGKIGSGGYRIASPLDVFVKPDEAVDVSAGVVALYRDYGYRDVRTRNRLAFLIEDWGEKKFREMLVRTLGRDLSPAGEDLRNDHENTHIGIYRQKQPSMNYVGMKVPVGRMDHTRMEKLAVLAEKYGNGEVRLSPANSVIVPNISDKKLGDFLEEPLLKEFDYNPNALIKGLVSCVGKDYCGMATIETKGTAMEVAKKLEKKLDGIRPITMNWSGCPAGCGNHLVADVGLIGKRARVDGKTVDAVDVFVGGRSGKYPAPALKILEDIPCDKLPDVLAQILPYHAREKMHPVEKLQKEKKPNAGSRPNRSSSAPVNKANADAPSRLHATDPALSN